MANFVGSPDWLILDTCFRSFFAMQVNTFRLPYVQRTRLHFRVVGYSLWFTKCWCSYTFVHECSYRLDRRCTRPHIHTVVKTRVTVCMGSEWVSDFVIVLLFPSRWPTTSAKKEEEANEPKKTNLKNLFVKIQKKRKRDTLNLPTTTATTNSYNNSKWRLTLINWPINRP